MLKKVLLLSSATAFMFLGCGSESTTSPRLDNQSNTNLSQSDSLKNNANDNKDSTENLVNALEAGKVGCSYEVLSDTSVVELIKELDVTTKVTVTIKGAVQEIEYYSTYASSVAIDVIQSLCEENKEDAAEHGNATVTCGHRTMTIKETVPSVSLDDLVQSAKNTCEEFNASHADIETVPKRAICGMRSTETSIAMSVMVPDSMSLFYEVEYKDNVLSSTSKFVFDLNVSKKVIQGFCDESKVNSIEYSTNGETRRTTCDSNQVVTITSQDYSKNPLSTNPIEELLPQIESFCDQIETTGKYPN
jgi:hypothetical protein